MGDHLIIGGSKPKKKEQVRGPNVTPEVEQWGALVNWLRTKEYTPDMVRATMLAYEEENKKQGEKE